MAFYLTEIKEIREEFIQAYGAGEYKKAALLCKRLLEIYQENEDSNNMEYAACMHNLAVVLDQLGLYSRAVEYYKKAAALKKACMGETASYADTLNNLAIAYHHTGRTDLSLDTHRRVLEIRNLCLGQEHVDYVHTLYHLGNAYEAVRQYEKARGILEKALFCAQRCSGFGWMDLSDIHAAMARCYDEIGNYRKAILYYEMAIDLVEKVGGEGKYYHMIYMISLAALCDKSGFTALAVEYCEKAIEIRRSSMGETNLDFINNLTHLAMVCCKDGQYQKAVATHTKALELVEETLGKDHAFYADILNSIAVDYCGSKDYTKAMLYCKKALLLKRIQMPADDPRIAVSLMTMGAIADEMGEFKKAAEQYAKGLEIRRKAFGENHMIFADSLCSIARLYQHMQAYEGAALCFTQALKIRKENGDTGEMYIWLLHSLADIRFLQGEVNQGVFLCRQGLELAEKRWGKSHPAYAGALKKLGFAFRKADDLEAAQRLLGEAMDIESETLDEDNPGYLKTVEALAEICSRRGEYQKAIGLYRERNDLNFEETPEEQREAAITLLAIANCYLCMGEAKKAAAHFGEGEARLRRSGLLPNEIYEKQRAFFEAISMGKKPRNAEHGKETMMRRQMEESLDFFLMHHKMLEKEEAEENKRAQVSLTIGEIYERLSKMEEAAKWYALAEKQGDGAYYIRACQKLGEVYLKQGDLDKAVRRLFNAKEYMAEYGDIKTEDYTGLLASLGDCYFRKGEKKAAINLYIPWNLLYLEQKLPFSEEYEQRLERLAKLLTEEKRMEEALEYYCFLSERGEKNLRNEEFRLRLLFKIAQIYIDLGSEEKSEGYLDKALEFAKNTCKVEAFCKVCDKAGRLYAAAGCGEKAEASLLLAYGESLKGKKCFTKDGLSVLLSLLRQKGDEKAYLSVKNGEFLE